MKNNSHPFGSIAEALIYPLLILCILYLVQLTSWVVGYNFVQWGVVPREWEQLIGIVLMPLIHSPHDWKHLLNNSLPMYMLMATVIYFYRDISFRVIGLSWIFSGLGVWLFAANTGSFHIGMSGVIYALAAFVFFSGYQRKFLPLQAMALFVAFFYGSLVWGIFPVDNKVSWEGHLSGLLVGIILSVVFLRKGPVAPKYQYEIEKEMGIEPPDLEGMYWQRVREIEEQELMRQKELELRNSQNNSSENPIQIRYHYRTNDRPGENVQ